MLYKNIRFAFRQLGKNKVFSFINVLGLSLSMVACLLIYKYVNFEQQYDAYHDDVDQIYRIYRLEEGEDPDDGVVQVFSGMKIPLETNLPDIKQVSRFIGYDKIFQSFAFTHFATDGETRTFNIPKGFFSDQGALSILKFNWIEGGDMASLNNPNEVVISESYAKKFFGNSSSVGKVLRFKNMAADFKVTGVYADLPTSTHLKFDMLCSMKSLPAAWDLDRKYDWGNFFTYVKTEPGVSSKLLEDKINDMLVDIDGAWFHDEGVTFKLQNIRDIHLESHHSYEAEANGNKDTVNFLSIIGVFIMVIAWVNYINLSTSKLVERAKEVGVRKVMGGHMRQLMGQFLVESILINLMALILSLTVLQLTRGFFETLIGIPIEFFSAEALTMTLVFASMFTLGSILFGLYPAVLYARQNISIVLRGKAKVNRSGLLLRRGLTIFQYVIAVILILGTIAVKKQLSFIQNESLGMNIDRTLIVKKPFMETSERESSKSAFMNSLRQMSDVKAVSASSEIPGYEISRMRWIALGPGSEDKALYAKAISIDESFVDLYGIDIIHGRSFSKSFVDSASVVLSLSAANDLLGADGLADWIGKTIFYESIPYRLIGIINDINQESLKSDIKPHIYTQTDRDQFYSIKLNTNEMTSVIEEIQGTFNASFATSHFEYFFLDTYFNRQYKADRLFGQIFTFFSLLAIVITSLGLFGLSLYNISQRAREISIRKILGAPVKSIFYLLTKEYLILMGLASVVALPIGYYFIREWLASFASQMEITSILFVLPLVLILVLTLLTVCYQVLKAIFSNPTDTLRCE